MYFCWIAYIYNIYIFFQMDGFKKIIPTELKELINLKPEGKYLFLSMEIVENPHTAIDPYCNEKIEIEFQCTNAPQGILLSLDNDMIYIESSAILIQ